MIYAKLALVAAICAGWFWLGSEVTSARYERRLTAVSEAVAKSYAYQIEQHNAALATERERAKAAQQKRTSRTQAAQKVVYEIAKDTDRSCEWRDLQRLRIDQLYTAYGYAPDGSPAGVSDSVSAAALNGATPRAVGGSGFPVGRGLQGAAR